MGGEGAAELRYFLFCTQEKETRIQKFKIQKKMQSRDKRATGIYTRPLLTQKQKHSFNKQLNNKSKYKMQTKYKFKEKTTIKGEKMHAR